MSIISTIINTINNPLILLQYYDKIAPHNPVSTLSLVTSTREKKVASTIGPQWILKIIKRIQDGICPFNSTSSIRSLE